MEQKNIRIAIIPISELGKVLAKRIQQAYPEAVIYEYAQAEKAFTEAQALVYIGALGICVRSIAPFIRDKHADPAVVCIDSTGKQVISVLSGHIGGANELTEELARLLHAAPVITTQSDNTGLWALDILPRTYDWAVRLQQKGVGTKSSGKQENALMNQAIASFVNKRLPKNVHIGMGCKRDMASDIPVLWGQLTHVLEEWNLCPEAIADINSIDLKADEKALVDLSATLQVPFHTYPAAELEKVQVPNPSEKVKSATGTKSVSEASAIRAADGGILVMPKQIFHEGEMQFTIAAAIESPLQQGHIEIVGAGPGDPELISVRGKHFLQQADLILYAGSLVPKELTYYAKPGATVRSSADMNLEEQFQLMKEFYDKGKLVVRLHTGDPCLYGAIQEQMNYFDQFGMSYHITPGISAFQAAAAELRSEFTVPEKVQTIILTRGEGRTPVPEKEQLHRLAESRSTMCIYLSATVADKVQTELLQHYSPETPVAVCYKLTWKDQRIYRGELKDLARIVQENNLKLTTLLVVGEAIGHREGLSRLYADEFKHLYRK